MVPEITRKVVMIFFLVWLTTANQVQSQEFHFDPPQYVTIGGTRLDVELQGRATPFAYDINMDGALDLLVGEDYGGRLRIYPGSVDTPLKFQGYHLFDDYSPEARIPSNNPFTPIKADIDQDGSEDLVTPSWHGNVSWFKRLGPNEFAGRQLLQCSNGREIDVEWTYSVAVIDWNGDGLEDLLVITSPERNGNQFFIFMNESADGNIKYKSAAAVEIAKNIPAVQRSNSRLATVDWNDDGRRDIVISNGSRHLYLLLGRQRAGEFDDPLPMQILPDDHEVPSATTFSVADLNQDGRIDILIGHDGERFKKQLSEQEMIALESRKNEYLAALRNWGRVYRSYAKLLQSGVNSTALTSVRQQVVKENRKQMQQHADINVLQMVDQSRSYVLYVLGK